MWSWKAGTAYSPEHSYFERWLHEMESIVVEMHSALLGFFVGGLGIE